MVEKKQIIIIGGGISGLSCAWYIKKQNPSCEITILEQRKQLGGYMGSDKGEIPRGPRIFKTSRSKELLDLIEECGLSSQIYFPKGPNARYLLVKGALKKIPGPYLLRFLFAALKEPFIAPLEREETIKEFMVRRFGKSIAQSLIDPLVIGIYAGKYEELSMNPTFPKLKQWEQRYGSILKGFFKERAKSLGPSLFTLPEGGRTVIDALEKALKEHIHQGVLAEKIEKNLNGYRVDTKDQSFYAKEVIVATNAAQAANLVGGKAKDLLQQIPYAAVTVIHVFLEERGEIPKGFGYLIPSKEEEQILGVLFDEHFMPGERAKLTIMAPLLKETEIESTIERVLRHHLGIKGRYKDTHVQNYTRAIPKYTLGHAERIEQIQQEIPTDIHLLGNYLYGVSVSDSIRLAKALAQRIA